MAEKKVIWSRNAKTQFFEILEFYIERNGNSKYSLKLVDEVEEILSILSNYEFLGRLASDRRSRVIPMKHFLIIYEIDNDRIEILSFWDNRQDLQR